MRQEKEQKENKQANADIFILIKQSPKEASDMMNTKFILLLFALCVQLNCFYISKQTVPTLFLNQQYRFNITHNAGQNVNFKLVSGPSFLSLKPNGQMVFLPTNQGSYQAIIEYRNVTSNANLITLSYVVNVLNRQNEFQKPLWLIGQSDFISQNNEKGLIIETDTFDFNSPIRTNQNIRLKLTTKNQRGNVVWFYQNLPQTMVAGRSTGVIQGFVQNEGNYMIKATAIDSAFKLGQIFVFLKFTQTLSSLQHDSYPDYTSKNVISIQQKQQKAVILENQIKSLANKKSQLNSKRVDLLATYKSITQSKEQAKVNDQTVSQKIKSKNVQNDVKNVERQIIQTELTNQKAQVGQARKLLSEKQKDHAAKLQESKKINSTQQSTSNDLRSNKTEFQSVKKEISNLQAQIYQQQSDIRDIQSQKARNNVTYVTLQKEEVRTRQILQIRKNIEFQYLIKKAQTDNKVRRSEDYVFLAQTNYDFAYAEYKKQTLLYLQYVIESSYLNGQIEIALQEYEEMNKTLNRIKLNHAIASGSVETLKVAKQQLSKLSTYALNMAMSNTTSSTPTETQMIQAQVKLEVQEYPFTGCQKIGSLAWAGSGKIKIIGKNSLDLGSEQTVNFGNCTEMKTKIKGQKTLKSGQWIQFSGYYWDGAVQATSITILSLD